MNTYKTLEFDKILEILSDNAMSECVKARCLALHPTLDEAEAQRWLDETTQARSILEDSGAPPLQPVENIMKVLALIEADAMLLPEQIEHVSTFLSSCRRLKLYLKKAEGTGMDVATFGGSIDTLPWLDDEINQRIVNGAVDNRASSALSDIRRKMNRTSDEIKSKLDALLRKNKSWFSESFVSKRNGHYTLPVRREFKNNVSGTLVDMSHTGSTCFIEPDAVRKLRSELAALEVEEDCEVRRVLYELTALISECVPQIKINIEAVETLDFIFAKGKTSLRMNASPVRLNSNRKLRLCNARHPLIDASVAVPLDFEFNDGISGVVITGPNTGGKTVSIKTVGLLSLMAQSGLHVPADSDSDICMQAEVLCDIGDGQSISENLSTFSSHVKNIIEVLGRTGAESLVLLDELGSGTDPAEGMGLAIAIIEELCGKGCLFAVTTHYPEVAAYAAQKDVLINARMAFDKKSLLPLYRLELGETGESCALYIAERLGMSEKILERARLASYGKRNAATAYVPEATITIKEKTEKPSQITPKNEQQQNLNMRCDSFGVGDSVIVYPKKEIGIVYKRANDRGELGVQIKGVKTLVNHKRIKLHVPASELYPDDYDFSIIFDTVENRKARHKLEKRHEEGTIVVLNEGNNSMRS